MLYWIRFTVFFAAACAPAPAPATREPPDPTTPEIPPVADPSSAPAGVSVEAPAGLCQPVIDVAPHALEGDVVTATVRCESGLDPAVLGVTWAGPSLVPSGDVATWATGLYDAGNWQILAAVASGGELPETAVASVSVADAWDDPKNIPVDPASYTEEWGVPVLWLDPAGPLSESYTRMDAWWQGVEYSGQMKIRGAASVAYPKNNYTLEFDPISLQLDGTSDKDHLVVIGNFDDNSYVRQKLVFDTWAGMAAASGEARLTPRTFFAVLYLDGEYLGLYTAVDHVDDEFLAEMGLDPSGDLYKSVTHDANYYLTNSYGSPKATLHDGWEKKDDGPAGDFDDLDQLTSWSAGVTDADFAAQVGSWLPVTEFGDWFLLVHHLAADDSAGKNAYLYDPPTGPTWWRYAPWDFNHALGQTWQTERESATVYNDFIWNNGIFGHIEREPGLSTDLWDRYRAYRDPGGPLNLATESAEIDAYTAQIDDEARRDWGKWEADYRSYWGWRDDIVDYDGEIAYVRQWIADRDTYMAGLHP
jgi:hypothetical protein